MQVSEINYFLALGTVLLQAVAVAMLGIFLLQKRSAALRDIAESVGRHGLLLGAVVAFAASFLALLYTQFTGAEPCPLCWWQRVFLVPQVLLLGLAAWKRDAYMADYSLILSFVGAGVALYQHVLQMMPGSGLPCPATGPSCAQRIIFEFGYVTFPLMAFSVFAFLMILMLFVRSRRGQ